MPKPTTYTKDELILAVKKSKSYRQVCANLNLKPQVAFIKKKIEKYQISTEHFNVHKKGKTNNTKYIGNTIGNLYILDSIIERNNNKNISYFICICNLCLYMKFKVLCSSVLRGSTTSCGCRRDQYQKIRGSNNVNWTGYKDISGTMIKKLKRGALKRGLDFELTSKYLWELFIKQNKKCSITGIDLSFGTVDNHQSKTASLDRIDNSKGYIIGNVQWVHKKINIMRGDNTLEAFYYLCRKVIDNYDKLLERGCDQPTH